MALPNWLYFSQLSGSGDTIVTITADTYTTLNDVREALFKVSGITKHVDVEVYQTGQTFYVSQTQFSFPSGGGSSAFTITTDANWVISPSSVGNFSFYPSSGTGSANVTLSCAANLGSSAVTATATVSGLSSSALTMVQAERPTISVSPSSTNIGTAGGSVTVTVTSSADWIITEGYGWVTPSVVSGTSGTSTVVLSISQNLANRVRRADVEFSCVGTPSVKASFHITQGSHAYDSSTPLTFEILSDGYICWTLNDSGAEQFPIEYNLNGNGWEYLAPTTYGSKIYVDTGDYVQFRGDNARYAALTWGHWFCSFKGSTAEFSAYGNIMSLINSTSYSGLTTLSSTNKNAFKSLFEMSSIVEAAELLLPATTLSYGCYAGMFNLCDKLVSCPELPATTLNEWCYNSMFYGCTALDDVPDLPATTLSADCYYGMFYGCTGLTHTPALPAMNLADYCYVMMFRDCTSLSDSDLPVLPATTLTLSCYVQMFDGCTGLVDLSSFRLPATTMAQTSYAGMFENCSNLEVPPTLPATTLAQGCYEFMFSMCVKLRTAPSLPATTMDESCYAWMFQRCYSLTTPPTLPSTTLAKGCYYQMFWDCTGLTTTPALQATTVAEECYYRMFDGCTNITTAPDLNAPVLAKKSYYAMFRGCSRLNSVKCLATDHSATDCTTNWLYGVANSGTFTKAAATNWSTGVDGIPNNWAIVDVV